MRYFLLFIFFIFQIIILQAQTIKGIIKDAKTKQGIALVGIIINKGEGGTTTDFEGNFEVNFPINEVKTIEITHISYEKFTYLVKNKDDLKPLNKLFLINLYEKERSLNEIVIKAGENPAHKIIKKASQNRQLNNISNLEKYSFTGYHKFILATEDAPKELHKKSDRVEEGKIDSADVDLNEYFKKHHILLTETITDYQYLKPNQKLEKVKASKTSGFKNPRLLALSANSKPVDFSGDFVQILDKEYLNPLAKGSTERYFFNIEDTLFQQKDTIFIISFSPLAEKNILGLEGIMHVHTKNYALQNVVLNNKTQMGTLTRFIIQQRAEWINDKAWFPVQTLFDVTFEELMISTTKRVKGYWKCYYDNFDVNPNLNKKDFSEVIQKIEPEAHTQTDEFWNKNRKEVLDNIDKNSYRYLDSLGTKLKWDRILTISEGLSSNRIGLGKYFDLDIDKILKINRYENLRLGAGAMTSQSFSERFSIGVPYTLGGYVGYGFGDQRIKYGFNFESMVEQKKQIKLGISYQDDLLEPAMINFLAPRQVMTAQTFRNLLAEKMDRIKSAEIYGSFRAMRGTTIKTTLLRREINTNYDYVFVPKIQNNDVISPNKSFFIQNEIAIQTHFAKNEEYLDIRGQRILNKIELPSASFNIRIGTLTQGSFTENYTKLEGRFLHKHKFLYHGTLNAEVQTGKIFGNLPYHFLYNGTGTTGRIYPFTQGFFQTVDIYEFLNSEFLNVFLHHNFGSIIPAKYKTKHFQPELTLYQFFGVGTLSNIKNHTFINTQSMEKGLFESGIGIDKLYRYKYINVAYLNLGVGIFGRYGAYSRTQWNENFAIKLLVKFEL
ncbi:MAG: hypothetical protein EAZ85_07045 [Bacteroidetes bacterium]|nr:MAG: hypothetical protein EAZ85_07045 [Bacteroidota bacterium]TAG86320.1 MAG: hypothetical protein EAZ20_13020 [Bacteroidota bacterium]